MPQPISFAGLTVAGLCVRDLLADSPEMKFVVTANSQIIRLFHRDANFRSATSSAVVTFDGQVPYVLAKLMNPFRRFEKISGSDLIYDVLLRASSNGSRVFFLGSDEHSNVAAVSTARRDYRVKSEGYAPPFFSFPAPLMIEQEIRERISAFHPDYLFVGFGAPKQELWISANREFLETSGVKIAVGCGGSIDFLAGRLRRAPHWVQKAGLEGFYRLAQQRTWARVKRLLESLSIFYYALRI